MTFTEDMIKGLESKGFRRWQKNGMDRLYINPGSLGLTTIRYNTGNVREAEFCGESISNSEARRMLESKTYIDINKGLVVSNNWKLAFRAAEIAGVELVGADVGDKILTIA